MWCQKVPRWISISFFLYVSDFSRKIITFLLPPPATCCYTDFKVLQFFSIKSKLSLEKYVRQKFLFCLFPIFFRVCLFFHFFYIVFVKKLFLRLELRILVGNRQTKFFSKKWKVWGFKILIHLLVVLKVPNLEKKWLFKHKPMMRKIDKKHIAKRMENIQNRKKIEKTNKNWWKLLSNIKNFCKIKKVIFYLLAQSTQRLHQDCHKQ